jgi:hypothetical protein
LTAAVNPSPPPEATGSQNPPASTVAQSSAMLANDTAVVTPPPNLNPSAGATIPPAIGTNNVALAGGTPAPAGDGVASSLNIGAAGICQTITLDSTNEYLTFWVYEAGLYGPFYDADQEADILNSSGTALYSSSSILFAEQNCLGDPGVMSETSYTASKCIPASLGGTATSFYYQGGFWTQRGPYNISSFVSPGSAFTLFLGVWDWETKVGPTSYGNVMFIANVQMTNSSTFPASAPYNRDRGVTLALPKGRAQAALAAKAHP